MDLLHPDAATALGITPQLHPLRSRVFPHVVCHVWFVWNTHNSKGAPAQHGVYELTEPFLHHIQARKGITAARASRMRNIGYNNRQSCTF